MLKANSIIRMGAVFLFLSVALGAFGAHVWSSRLSEKELSIFHTATQYMAIHGLGILFCSRLESKIPACFFIFGILLFSGSLLAWLATGWQPWVYITPLGGCLFLFGWASLIWSGK